MSKKGYISRYNLILKKLKASPYSTIEELCNYVKRHYEFLKEQDDSLTIGFSKRTFQRDIEEIRKIFGIEIEYSKKNEGYFISSSEMDFMNFERRMEAFDMFQALNLNKDLASFILLEKRRSQGTENIHGLLHAIKNRVQITFSYAKYYEDKITQRITEPYALKEFKHRWYLLAKDKLDGKTKTFALDRLSNLEFSNTRFEYLQDTGLEESFRYCFGIMNPGEGQPQEIILSCTSLSGKYLKSLPIHETQQIILDNEKEFRIKLKLFITSDFIAELMAHGENLKVLQPQSLADDIKSKLEMALAQYQV